MGSIGNNVQNREESIRIRARGGVVKSAAIDYVEHHLGSGETYARVLSAEQISDIDKNGMADVRVEYSVDVRYPVGMDLETGLTEYESDREYRTNTFRIKIRR